MQETPDILIVFQFLYKNRKSLFLAALGGALLLGVITIFLPKKYSSTAIIFPTGGNDVDKNLQFGMDIHNDQLMQLLQSDAMKDSVVKKFDLIKYYELDLTESGWQEKLTKYFERDIHFSKTRYYSIEISAETTNPKLSADIVNSIVDFTQHLYWQIIRQNSKELLVNTEKNYASHQQQMNTLADSLRRWVDQKGDTIHARLLRLTLMDLQKGVTYTKGKRDYVRERHEMPASPLFVMDNGKPAGKKSSPRYSINMLMGALGMFFFACLVLIMKDLYKKNKNLFEEID